MTLIITLIVLGIVLLLVELIIIPGFGITGVLGIASLVGGVVMAYYKYDATIGHIILAATLVLCGLCTWYLLQSKTWKRLALNESITAQAIDSAKDKGLDVGMTGFAVTRLAPMGLISVNGIETEAVAFEGIINAKQLVEIVKIDGTKVIVKTY